MDSNYYGFQRSGSVNTESLVWAEDPEVLDELSSFVGILPDNYLSVRGSLSTRSPEAAMMCAILEDAVNCFQRQLVSPTRRASRLGQEAEEWFFDDDCRWLFSFVSICNVLGLDPGYIRRGLKRRDQGNDKKASLKNHRSRVGQKNRQAA
jgi:hypothetical protein